MSANLGRAIDRHLDDPLGLNMFISYSHFDEEFHDELIKHLKPLEREGFIRPWHDRRITAGKEFNSEIDEKLNSAEVILLLVSSNFISSEYCWGKEMLRAMEKHASGGARVIPVILKPVDWHNTPFGKLMACPKDGKAVTLWENRDSAYLDIARAVSRVLEIRAKGSRLVTDLSIKIVSSGFTTDYCGVFVILDIANGDRESVQVVQCTLEIPLLGITLQHAPGPPNVNIGEPWMPRVPFVLEGRKLSRGSLFFAARSTSLEGGLPNEPLSAKLTIDIFLKPALEQWLEIESLESLRKKGNVSKSEGTTAQVRLSPAEKILSMTERRL